MEFQQTNTRENRNEPHQSGFGSSYLTASELKRNHREIESIARETGQPRHEIAAYYADVYADMKSHAKVLDYLPVLVARRVRARYQN